MDKIGNYVIKREVAIGLLIFLLVVAFIPFKVLSYGWTPTDDALRHVAFSTVDVEWSDVLVIKPDFASDHNPGWHWILKVFNKLGLDKDDLLSLSVVGLFVFVHIVGLLVTPKPVGWFLSFFILMLIDPSFLYRFLLGRPYIFTFAISFILLKLWTEGKCIELQKNKTSELWKGIITTVLVALSAWIHGSWYLFFLIAFSFALAGKFKDAGKLSIYIFLGAFLGAFMSGDFWGFMYFQKNATLAIFTEDIYNWLLVTEFSAGGVGVIWILSTVCVFTFLLKKKNKSLEEILLDPALILVLLGCCLGIMTYRFWGDWGAMALVYWLAKVISQLFPLEVFKNLRIKYSLFIFLMVTIVFLGINDGEGRFSKESLNQPIDFTKEELKSWAPGEGGVVYSNSMMAFYKHFFAYPKAKWKYILGFESVLMLDEDKATLRQIAINNGMVQEDYMPWINKMRAEDRLILERKLPYSDCMLEWKMGARHFWIGRKIGFNTLE